MASLFSKPKTPKVPKPEVVDEDPVSIDETLRNRKRKGRASTVLASDSGGPATASRVLTGN